MKVKRPYLEHPVSASLNRGIVAVKTYMQHWVRPMPVDT